MDAQALVNAAAECTPPTAAMIGRKVGMSRLAAETALTSLVRAGVLRAETWRGVTNQTHGVVYLVNR